ncbi:MAG: RNA polymerase-binding protein DksA [Proteobacteria bacterium]|nr:MAG: RNA polymerase-binding protein DksA [Pseudomonadota bacterium]
MAVKRPSAKAKKAGKTVSKAPAAKKAAPAKKSPAVRGKSAPGVSTKSAGTRAAKVADAKPASRPTRSKAAAPTSIKAAPTQQRKVTKTPKPAAETAESAIQSAPEVAAETALKATQKPSARAAAPASATPPEKAPAPARAIVPPSVDVTDAGDEDDGDDAETNPNLLAGPRDVKPYIVRRGEQYMSKEQLEHFRQILNNWKRDLMQEVDRTVLHMKDEAANFPDPNDRATQESEFSLELRTRDRERKLIRKIDEALKRIDDGTYGYCMETGEEIGIKRLEARPVATLCVEAQERRERREKQYGDRDDRYR